MTAKLSELLTDLAEPAPVIDPVAVRRRAEVIRVADRRRGWTVRAAAAAALVVVTGTVVAVAGRGPGADDRLQTGQPTSSVPSAPSSVVGPPPGTAFEHVWVERARRAAATFSPRNGMQAQLANVVWTRSELVVPGGPEAVTVDVDAGVIGSLPASLATADDGVSARRTLPWIWTGAEILRFDPPARATGDGTTRGGGSGSPDEAATEGQAFDAITRTWRSVQAPPLASTAGLAWAGTRLLAWSGEGVVAFTPDGGRGTWESLTADDRSVGWTPSPAVVWTGTELVFVSSGPAGVQAFDPAAGTWRPLPALPGGGGSDLITAAWTGSEVLAYDAVAGAVHRLDPTAGAWVEGTGHGVAGWTSAAAMWTGDRFVVLGGSTSVPNGPSATTSRTVRGGLGWDPGSGAWAPLPEVPADEVVLAAVVIDGRVVVLDQADRSGPDDGDLVVRELRS